MYVNWMEFDLSDVPLSCVGGRQKAMGEGFTGVSKVASCQRKFMIAQIPFLGFKIIEPCQGSSMHFTMWILGTASCYQPVNWSDAYNLELWKPSPKVIHDSGKLVDEQGWVMWAMHWRQETVLEWHRTQLQLIELQVCGDVPRCMSHV